MVRVTRGPWTWLDATNFVRIAANARLTSTTASLPKETAGFTRHLRLAAAPVTPLANATSKGSPAPPVVSFAKNGWTAVLQPKKDAKVR